MAELSDDRKLATLAAFAAEMEAVAADEAIEVVDLVHLSGSRAGKRRLRSIKDLDTAALILREAWLAITCVAADGDDVRAALEQMDTLAIDSAAAVVGELACEPDEDIQAELTERHATIAGSCPGCWTRSARRGRPRRA